jgi:prolyl oligopeptidase
MLQSRSKILGLASLLLLWPLSALIGVNAQAAVGSATINKLPYPKTAEVTQVDNYHGTKVSDPYRWLEDANSAKTKAWVEAQNKVTFAYLGGITCRQAVKERLTKLWDFEKYSVPEKQGDRYFYGKNTGLQNQSVVYTTRDLATPGELLLDPNTLSKDGTVALAGSAASDDGKLFAYGLAAAGSDWQEWKIRNVESKQDLSDDLKWIKFSGVSFTKDGKGLYYSRFDAPDEKTKLQATNYYQKLYYHKLGDDQSKDTLIYERKDHKDWDFEGAVTDDGHYLVISSHQGTDPKNRIFYKDLTVANAKVVELFGKGDAKYNFIENDGSSFWFVTDLQAPRSRVIAVDLKKPDAIKEVIAEAKDTIEDVNLAQDTFIVSYLKDAHSDDQLFDLNGQAIGSVQLPGIGAASGFSGKRKQGERFFSYVSFTQPSTIYRFDINTKQTSTVFEPKLNFDPAKYVTKQVFYTSKDGTKVPMFITSKIGTKLTGNTPTLLEAYGGFDIPYTPVFSPTYIVWMEMGGIYAVPNLRGGGEYGEKWHQAGMKDKKQNVFNDFIAAAEYLIREKYTNKSKLAIAGASNGGLLIGACETQRPNLYGACLPSVGVMDMLRFQKFTIGWAWTSEYGSSDNAQDFKTLYAYSPLHHIKPGVCYPATLICTGDHDDRVVPAHSFKFAATMQKDQACSQPILIRIETRAGHGAGKPTSKKIEEKADQMSFLVKTLKMPRPKF